MAKGVENSTSQNSIAPMVHIGNFLSKTIYANCWMVDTRASNHLTGSMEKMVNHIKCDGSLKVSLANGETSPKKERENSLVKLHFQTQFACSKAQVQSFLEK